MNIQDMTIFDLREAMESGETTSLEIVKGYLARCDELNGALNVFVEIFEKEAISDAKKWDKARANNEELPPLAGIPIAIKDNILISGKKATAGSKILSEYTAVYDSTAVQKLRDAGAIIFGRTNMDEFAMGSSTETSSFGATKNPWNTNKVPGGSSGGSAAAVAAGLVPAALGTDTGGSVRQPASLTGVVGLKPTYGRVSRYGLIALASSLDQIGVFAHTAKDAALVLEIIEGEDEHDATSVNEELTIPELLDVDVKGMTIGVPDEYFVDEMDSEIRSRVEDAIEVFKKGGAKIKKISLPHTEYSLATYYVILPCEASSNLARFDGIRYGAPAESETLLERYIRTRSEGFGREVKRRIMIGTYALSSGYYDAYYKKALQVRAKIREDFDSAFRKVDLILAPTSPCVAWDIGEKFDDPLTMYMADIFTTSANLAGIPGISLPCGLVENLPVGLQLLAKPFDEYSLFKAGAFYQDKTDWHTKSPGLEQETL